MEGQERVPASSARVRDGVCLRRDRSPKQHRLQRGRCFRAAVCDRAHRLRPSGRRGSGCCLQAATCGCSTLRRPLCPAAAPAMGCSPVCVPLRAVITSCAVLVVCSRAQRPSASNARAPGPRAPLLPGHAVRRAMHGRRVCVFPLCPNRAVWWSDSRPRASPSFECTSTRRRVPTP